jgi:hypothetical protein
MLESRSMVDTLSGAVHGGIGLSRKTGAMRMAQLRPSSGSLLFTLRWRPRPRLGFIRSVAMNNGSPNNYGMGMRAKLGMREPISQMGTGKMTPRYAFHKSFIDS